jgi:hypothetical protein
MLPATCGVNTREEISRYIHKVAASINHAMDVSMNRKDGQYIFGIDVVRGKNFYGYSPTESLFLKVNSIDFH